MPPYRCGSSSPEIRLLVIDWKNAYGLRFLDAFELEAAEHEFRLAMDLTALASEIPGIQAREDAARGGLERIVAMLEDR